ERRSRGSRETRRRSLRAPQSARSRAAQARRDRSERPRRVAECAARSGLASGALGLAQPADASLLPDLAAQVIELRAVAVPHHDHFELVDLRRVERERALDANAERVLADGERLACTGALALDHDALEHLDALPRAFDDLEVHAHGVARLETGHFAQLTALDVLDDRAHVERGRRPSGMVAATES